jgi:hypothetical protein
LRNNSLAVALEDGRAVRVPMKQTKEPFVLQASGIQFHLVGTLGRYGVNLDIAE